MPAYTRRDVLGAAATGAAALALPRFAFADDGRTAVYAEIGRRHDEAVRRLQDWIRQPAIAAENRGGAEGCDLMMQLARDAGFQIVAKIPTDGQPGVFATLDAGAARTVGLYFMYDVKQADPSEWTSPPFAAAARPPDAAQRAMLDAAAGRLDEATAKKMMGVTRWAHGDSWRASLERFCFSPTVNIEGLVAGYTGPGGKTVLPHRAVAKLDLRLVPDMTYAGALAALRAHLAKHGFGDIEVHDTGGYDPTQSSPEASLLRAQLSVYRRAGLDPFLWPRNAGSYPGWVFTGEPLKLASGHFGLGHGSGAHAPDEYFVIESTNTKVAGFDGAVRSFVDYLWELAEIR